ncbi:MAG: hypothetical protein Fur005_48280 [Roseiflexaceae bacterium]
MATNPANSQALAGNGIEIAQRIGRIIALPFGHGVNRWHSNPPVKRTFGGKTR